MLKSLVERLARVLHPDTVLRRVVAFAVACLACAAMLAEWSFDPLPELREGDVASRDLLAPLDFDYVDAASTAANQSAAEAEVAPVYDADLTLSTRIENRVSQAFDMARGRVAAVEKVTPEESAAIADAFAKAIEVPIEPAELAAIAAAGYSPHVEDVAVELIGVAMRRNVIQDRTSLPEPQREIVVVSRFGGEQEEGTLDDFSLIRTPEEARQVVTLHVLERFASDPDPKSVAAAASIARGAVRANFTPNLPLTERRRAEARAKVPRVEVQIQRGTRLVASGEVVTASHAALLGALREHSGQAAGVAGYVGWLTFVVGVLGATLAFAQATIRKFASRTRDREALAFALLLVLLFGRLLSWATSVLTFPSFLDPQMLSLLVPVAGGAMLVRVLVNSESALVWSLVAALFSGILVHADALVISWYVVTALVATMAVGPARERIAMLRAGLYTGLAGAAFALVIGLLAAQDASTERPFTLAVAFLTVTVALSAGLLNAVLALGIVPAFELFGFVTDYKLLELASLNHPLLRQLMLRAPGTYHHSVIVGTLSEAACETIGANALLARVACYFHDIGKGLKPQYFVENQRELGNRHDRLSPEASAAVIINHVREGGVLAIQHNLPRPIYDNIFMHHGTGLIQYFYARAKEQAGPGEIVDERLFRYPGPKPDSREAGVIMIADKVEAACRTIKEPNEERIRAMIQQIINSVMSDGQFESCPLTLRELYQIADTFTTVLLGIYHHRIEYPTTKEISSGKGKFFPMPKQGTITLEIMNPLKAPPPVGSGLPGTVPGDEEPTIRRVDES